MFSFGFAKDERDNIDADELATARDIAGNWLAADAQGLALAMAKGSIQEIVYGDESEEEA